MPFRLTFFVLLVAKLLYCCSNATVSIDLLEIVKQKTSLEMHLGNAECWGLKKHFKCRTSGRP